MVRLNTPQPSGGPSLDPPAKGQKPKRAYADTLENIWLGVHGPSGVGKTTLFGTWSEFWDKKKKELDDMLFVELDNTGAIVLGDHGKRAPSLKIDNYIFKYTSIIDCVKDLLDDIYQNYEAYKPNVIAFDPVSELDKIIVERLWDSYDANDKRGLWSELLKIHSHIISFFAKNIRCNIGFGFHSTPMKEDTALSNSTKATLEAARNKALNTAAIADAAANIEVDIYGKSKNRYRARMRFIGSMQQLRGGKREVYFSDNLGFEAKSSFEKYLKDWREPNLTKMFAYLKKQGVIA